MVFKAGDIIKIKGEHGIFIIIDMNRPYYINASLIKGTQGNRKSYCSAGDFSPLICDLVVLTRLEKILYNITKV